MNDPIDLPAYFRRIGYQVPGGRALPAPELSTLHAIAGAHAAAIPFENLDVLLGRPIDLEIGAVFRKLVIDRRGGYCFEQNVLLLHGQPTPHEPRRIVRENGRLFHQVRFGDEWQDVCEFTLEEMPPIDRELANWFTSSHPQSHFRNRLIVARAAADGARLTLLNNEFKIRDRDGHADTRTIASADALLEILDQHFGLRFPVGTRFGSGDSNPWPTT